MMVTGHDHVGFSLNRAFQDAVVVRVVADDIEHDARGDNLSCPGQQLGVFDDATLFPLEIVSENVSHLVDNRGRYQKEVAPVPCRSP
jgi:hypothetical protein